MRKIIIILCLSLAVFACKGKTAAQQKNEPQKQFNILETVLDKNSTITLTEEKRNEIEAKTADILKSQNKEICEAVYDKFASIIADNNYLREYFSDKSIMANVTEDITKAFVKVCEKQNNDSQVFFSDFQNALKTADTQANLYDLLKDKDAAYNAAAARNFWAAKILAGIRVNLESFFVRMKHTLEENFAKSGFKYLQPNYCVLQARSKASGTINEIWDKAVDGIVLGIGKDTSFSDSYNEEKAGALEDIINYESNRCVLIAGYMSTLRERGILADGDTERNLPEVARRVDVIISKCSLTQNTFEQCKKDIKQDINSFQRI